METITRYIRRNAKTGKTEFRNTLHKRGKFGWEPVTLRWVECVYDICGNDRNPGMCADLWEDTTTGRKAVVFQGAWQRYLPRTRPGIRVPTWIFLDEYSPVDFDGDLVLKWMARNFAFDVITLPTEKVYPYRPRVTVPNHQPGLPYVGRADGVTAFKLSREEMTALNAHVTKSHEGFQTTDKHLRFETISRHRFDADLQYIVYRDDKAWFVTGNYNFILQLFWRHTNQIGLRMAA